MSSLQKYSKAINIKYSHIEEIVKDSYHHLKLEAAEEQSGHEIS